MSEWQTSGMLWAQVALWVAGLAAAWLARCSEGSGRQSICHGLFLGLLGLVGLSSVVNLLISPGFWLTSSFTLSVMILSATYHRQTSDHATAW